jgi:hypothetical protein
LVSGRARPDAPTLPLELQAELAVLPPLLDPDPEQIRADLRRIEAALPVTAPEGDAWSTPSRC